VAPLLALFPWLRRKIKPPTPLPGGYYKLDTPMLFGRGEPIGLVYDASDVKFYDSVDQQYLYELDSAPVDGEKLIGLRQQLTIGDDWQPGDTISLAPTMPNWRFSTTKVGWKVWKA